MEAGIRRVAIDDDASTYVSAGYETYDEGTACGEDPYDDESEDWALSSEVNALRAQGWSAAQVATYLQVSESEVAEVDRSSDDDDNDDFRQTPEEAYGLEPDSE